MEARLLNGGLLNGGRPPELSNGFPMPHLKQFILDANTLAPQFVQVQSPGRTDPPPGLPKLPPPGLPKLPPPPSGPSLGLPHLKHEDLEANTWAPHLLQSLRGKRELGCGSE